MIANPRNLCNIKFSSRPHSKNPNSTSQVPVGRRSPYGALPTIPRASRRASTTSTEDWRTLSQTKPRAAPQGRKREALPTYHHSEYQILSQNRDEDNHKATNEIHNKAAPTPLPSSVRYIPLSLHPFSALRISPSSTLLLPTSPKQKTTKHSNIPRSTHYRALSSPNFF